MPFDAGHARALEGHLLNCRRALKALPEILDDGGSDALRAAVEEHLHGCPACRREREALSRSWELLDAVRAPAAGPQFTAAVMTRVRASDTRGALPRRATAGPGIRSWWLAPAGAMALVALLVVSALVTWTHRPPGRPPTPAVVAALPSEPGRMPTDEDIIRDLDVYEQLDVLDNLWLLADLEVLEDSEVEL